MRSPGYVRLGEEREGREGISTSIDGDGVAAPDIFGVDVGEANVLDDDVLCVADDADSFALNDALGALADQTLVGADGHAEHTSLVVGDFADLGCVGLVVDAPVVLVNGKLAVGCGSPWCTSRFGGGAFRASKVEGLRKNDNTG
jgi:hypothetical protein